MMKQNKYDNEIFFEKYSQMSRSKQGLSGAGEWKTLEKMLPDFHEKRVLDLGCGYGWHCRYAIEHGAKEVIGIDISEKMIAIAKEKNQADNIRYQCCSIEDFVFENQSFDVVISSLAFHYLASFRDICGKVNRCLKKDGNFVFSVEHPIFTAEGKQDWYYDENHHPLHWPVDNYFVEGKRNAVFLGEEVVKYHRTLTTYLNELLQAGFQIKGIVEPQPDEQMIATIAGMKDELRRPMMLLISAKKQ